MSLNINTNIPSLDAQRNLGKTQASLQTSLARLSSGLRINSAADDSAGLAISTKMNAQVKSMNQAVRNANDGISLLQTADGALGEVTNILTRMRELSTQASNGTLSTSDHTDIGNEFSQLQSEITRIANSASFNGTDLLSGATGTTVTIQVGAGTTANVDTIDLKLGSTASDAAGLKVAAYDATTNPTGIAVTDTYAADGTTLVKSAVANATAATKAIDNALDTVNGLRSNIGAYQNRLTSTINNLQVAVENTTAAQSRIQDVDVAAETANMTSKNILAQAGVSILAQANQQPQLALKLLQ